MLEDKLENRYAEEGFRWAASVPIRIPWYRYTVKCTVVQERVLSELDHIVCKCVGEQINTVPDIAFVLSLDPIIVQGELNMLESDGMIQNCDNVYQMTGNGRDSYARHSRVQKSIEEYPIFMNGLTGRWSVAPPSAPDETLGKTLSIQPLLAAGQAGTAEQEKLCASLSDAYGGYILSMAFLDVDSVLYQEEKMLVYQKEGERNVKIAFLDEVQDDWDIDLGAALTSRYERRELLELLRVEEFVQKQKEKLIGESQFSGAYAARTREFKYCRNRQIRELLKNSFSAAESSVFIVSPWIDHNNYVVTEQFLSDMESALKRGIKISIGYGYLPHGQRERLIKRMRACDKKTQLESTDRNWQTERMACVLSKRFRSLPFEIFYVGTHEKLLIVDDRYCYVGSFNLLSYDGGEQYDFADFRSRYEGGLMVDSAEIAGQIKSTVYQSLPPANGALGLTHG